MDAATDGYFGARLIEYRSDALFVTERRYRARQRIGAHEHAAAYVCIVTEGSYRERSEAGVRECAASTVLLHPAQSRHSDAFHDSESRCLMIEIDGSWSRAAELDAHFARPRVMHGGAPSAIAMRLVDEARRIDDVSPLALEALLLELLDATQAPATGAAPAWLVRARQRLDDAPLEAVSVAQLAALASVHPVHFSRTFRSHLGCSVADYVRTQRLRVARDRIRAGEALADVAAHCGFADQSHLTRAFRRALGITPGQARGSRLEARGKD